MITRSAVLPTHKAGHPADLPVKGEGSARTGAVRYPRGLMKEEKEEELEETKELFKEGLDKIWRATKKATKDIVKGFKQGYSEEDEKER
jgi:hypothetical protein